jgi:hypothetical protein
LEESSDVTEEDENYAAKGRITWKQRLTLENIYASKPYPSLTVRNKIGKQLDMAPRRVQIWFQNRRMKDKSIKDKPAYILQTLASASDGDPILSILLTACHASIIQQIHKREKETLCL